MYIYIYLNSSTLTVHHFYDEFSVYLRRRTNRIEVSQLQLVFDCDTRVYHRDTVMILNIIHPIDIDFAAYSVISRICILIQNEALGWQQVS